MTEGFVLNDLDLFHPPSPLSVLFLAILVCY